MSPVWNFDWKRRANFSSMTLSVPFFSARLIFFNCMFLKVVKIVQLVLCQLLTISSCQYSVYLKLHVKCRVACCSSKLPVLLRISPDASAKGLEWFCCWAWACASERIDTVTNGLFRCMLTLARSKRTVAANLRDKHAIISRFFISTRRTFSLGDYLPCIGFHDLGWLFLDDKSGHN